MAAGSRRGGWVAWVLVAGACGPKAAAEDTGQGTTSGDPVTTVAPDTSSSPATSSTSGVEPVVTSSGVEPGATTTGVEPGATTTDGDPDATSTSSDPTRGEASSSVGPEPCQLMDLVLPLERPKVMLVLDKSGSMANINGLWDHDANPNTPEVTHWNSLRQVVAGFVGAHDGALDLGANLFPSTDATQTYDITACPVNAAAEVPIAAMNGPAILAGIPKAGDMSLQGATPAAAGMAAAIAQLEAQPGAPLRAAVLVTDGPANCNEDVRTEPERFEVYDDGLHTLVGGAFKDAGIVTHVVGLEIADMVTDDVKDGSPDAINPFIKLNELAVLGGRPGPDPKQRFHHAKDQIALQAAFDAIAADLLRCVVQLPEEPVHPDFVEVDIGNVELPRVQDCASEDGWVYVNPQGPFDAIELCGSACQDLKVAGEVEVEFFCLE